MYHFNTILSFTRPTGHVPLKRDSGDGSGIENHRNAFIKPIQSEAHSDGLRSPQVVHPAACSRKDKDPWHWTDLFQRSGATLFVWKVGPSYCGFPKAGRSFGTSHGFKNVKKMVTVWNSQSQTLRLSIDLDDTSRLCLWMILKKTCVACL